MLRNIAGLFVLAHGLVTIAIWTPNPETIQPTPPMDTSHSWLLGQARGVSVALAITAGVLLVCAGLAFLVGAAWWPIAAIVAGVVSLFLFGLFFTPWWLAAIAISAGLVTAAVRELSLT